MPAPETLAARTSVARVAPRAPATPALSSPVERARRRLVRLVLVIFLLAIFEGAVRKYLFPTYGQAIFFIRDPIVLWAYAIALRWRLWPRGPWMALCWAWGLAGLVLWAIQSSTGGQSDFRLLLGAYGWRAYFLYAPLALLIGAQFRREDVLTVGRWTLWLAVPVSVLVGAQFFSPPGAKVNVGTAEDNAYQFQGLVADLEHVRAAGPFSSNVGQQQFVITGVAFLLAFLLVPRVARRASAPMLTLGGLGILSCIALSGSRGTMLEAGITLLATVPLALIGRGGRLKMRAFLLPGLLAAVAVALYPIVFPAGFAAFMHRWDTAAVAEQGIQGGVFGRALYNFFDFFRLWDQLPLVGWGLGYGGNAAVLLHATVDGAMLPTWVETDWSRHMVDLGPLFGTFYIVWRIALSALLMGRVWRATRRAADPLPMMLFSYAAYIMVFGQITGNGSVNVYGWLFFGLCLAACRTAAPGDGAPARPRVLDSAAARRRSRT